MNPKTVTIVAMLAVASVAGAESSSTATGVSRLMNPAISLNALFLAQTSADVGEAEANRIAIQEAEMQLTSVVDPFWTADMIVAWHEEHEEEDAEKHAHGAPHYATDIEVARIRSTSMPAGLGLTLGKFYLPFGKHAVLHTHQFPFVAAPISVQAFLGGHGLTDVGAAVDATVPLPWWSELVVYGVDGRADIFNGEHRDLAYGVRWNHLWDVSDDATLELGGSHLTGPAAGGGHDRLSVTGFDLTFKWSRGDRSQGEAVTFSGEVFLPDYEGGPDDVYGYHAYIQSRMARKWWFGIGLGHVDAPTGYASLVGEKHDDLLVDAYEYKVNAVFAPSEFSAVRAEVSWLDENDLRFMLQWNFTIGSHPAHLY
jgi:hypothetical protein